MIRCTLSLWVSIVGSLVFLGKPVGAYITAPVATLGGVVAESTYVTLVKVEKFDPDRGIIMYTKLRDLKGKYPLDKIRHAFDLKNTPAHKGSGDVPVRPDKNDWTYALKWAEKGKQAVVFSRKYDPYGDFGHTYMDGLWYATMCPARDWDFWYAIYADPMLFKQWHAGTPLQLAQAVEVIAAGRTGYVPVLAKGSKEDLRAGKATLFTLRASLSIRNYDASQQVQPQPLESASIAGLLKTLTEDPNRDARAHAAGALGLLRDDTKQIVDALAKSVQTDPSGTVRMAAADALVRLLPEGRRGLSAIEAALKDPAMSTRKDVLIGLEEVRSKLRSE